jgi:site-specific recombinase XerC
VPLWKTTVNEVRQWLRVNPSLQRDSALLPNRDGHPMTRSNVEKRLDLAVARALLQCPSLGKKRISPHVIRHYFSQPTIME